MKGNKFDKEMLIRSVKNYLYWQMEAEENIRNGDFVMFPLTCLTVHLHDASMIHARLDLTDEEWGKIYQEASELARKEYLGDKSCIAKD